jgi:hypothetical protein
LTFIGFNGSIKEPADTSVRKENKIESL